MSARKSCYESWRYHYKSLCKTEYNGKPNPNYKQIVIHIGPTYTQCLNYNGEIGKYYTHDAKGFEIAGHIDFKKLILGE